MIISDDLFFNVVQDFKKKDVSITDRGNLIKVYLKEKGISEREFSKRFGFPHSTVHDWVSGRQLNKKSNKLIGVYTLTDRLFYLLSINDNKDLDVRTLRKLKELKELIGVLLE